MSGAPPAEVAAVFFDLDDTLFDQTQWLDGAWEAVVAAADLDGPLRAALLGELRSISAKGSDQGRIIDRALQAVGLADMDASKLVDAFRSYSPERLAPYPGATDGITALRRHVPVGLVTDGHPKIQQAKLDALGLAEHFDAVVFSDFYGREHRKPDPLPFKVALSRLGASAKRSVFVGDRPDKDMVGAAGVGMHCVRVRTGEYTTIPSPFDPWFECPTVTEAIHRLLVTICDLGRNPRRDKVFSDPSDISDCNG